MCLRLFCITASGELWISALFVNWASTTTKYVHICFVYFHDLTCVLYFRPIIDVPTPGDILHTVHTRVACGYPKDDPSNNITYVTMTT